MIAKAIIPSDKFDDLPAASKAVVRAAIGACLTRQARERGVSTAHCSMDELVDAALVSIEKGEMALLLDGNDVSIVSTKILARH